jgi:eukaryotic-like serine/threonine-protein kinase
MLDTILRSHYQIIKVVSKSNTGTTYLAKDLDAIDSAFYLVKQLDYEHCQAVSPPLIDKNFEIQAEIAHQVGKCSQVPSLVARFTENSHKYLVREYIDGTLLSQELTPGTIWSQTQVVDFLFDLIEILCFIERLKYIHQAINPQHIIRRHEDGKLHLIGFSSVRDLRNTWHLPNYATHNRNEPSYTSYEQSQNVSHLNSDLYAVGAIAIQALTGKFPLEKDNYSHELKWQDEVKIDRRLVEIVNRMVRPDYRNRYRSAAEVLAALKSFAVTQETPIRKSHQFQPYLLLGTAIGALLLGFGGGKLFDASERHAQLLTPVTKIDTQTVAANNEQSWSKYVDKLAKISMKYPATWHREDVRNIVTGEQALLIAPLPVGAKYRANISIRIESLTNPQTTLASYTQSTIAEIEKYDRGAKTIASSSVILAKRPAHLVVYTGTDENSLPIKNLEVWTIDRGKAYILTYRAEPEQYDRFLETIMATIDSFELN